MDGGGTSTIDLDGTGGAVGGLFCGAEYRRRGLRRPLGSFSDVAAEHPLPRSREIARSARGAVIDGLSPAELRLGSLDANLVVHRLRLRGDLPWPVVRELQALLARSCGKPMCLTYEDVVLNNPLEDDPRTICDLPVAAYERDFYLGHLAIERLLREAREHAGSAIASQLSTEAESLTLCAGAIERARDLLVRFRTELPGPAFGQIRAAIEAGRVGDAPAPSGRFSLGLAALETVVAGEAAWPPSRESELLELTPYFAVDQLAEVMALRRRHRGRSLIELAGDNHGVHVVCDAIHSFRAAHFGTVHHHLLKAAKSPARGTGGVADAGRYLRDRQRELSYTWKGVHDDDAGPGAGSLLAHRR